MGEERRARLRLAACSRARKVRCAGLASAVLEGLWGEEQQLGHLSGLLS